MTLAVAMMALCGFFVVTDSASADGRALIGQFGTAGSGAGQLGNPRGLAVNRSGAGGVTAGDVYVAEQQHHRVSQFSASGAFVRSFGLGVNQTTGGNVCTAASGDVCKAGAAGSSAAGAVTTPLGAAIDQDSGNVYVYSNTNRRIDVFSATGVYQGSFGLGVIDGGPELQFCTVLTACQAGANTGAAGGFATNPTARTLATDSDGHLYVPNPGNLRLDEFELVLDGSDNVVGVSFVRAIGWDVIPEGQPGDTGTGLEMCTTASGCKAGIAGGGDGQFSVNSPQGVAVDASGAIYTVNVVTNASTACSTAAPCRVQKFNADGSFNSNFGPSSGQCQVNFTSGTAQEQEAMAVAVDSSDQHVYVLKKTALTAMQVCEYDSAGNEISISPGEDLTANQSLQGSLAIGTSGRVYTANPTNAEPNIFILGPVPAPGATIAPVTDIAATSVTFNGTVTVPAGPPVPATKYRFEYSTNGIDWTRVPDTDLDVGDGTAGDFSVSETVTGLVPNTAYQVRLVARTGPSIASSTVLFTTAGQSPFVAQETVILGTDRATISAFINPRRSSSTYHVDWGLTDAYGSRTPDFERPIGSDNAYSSIQESLAGLVPGTTYHFRVVAKNAAGTTTGADHTFATDALAGQPNGRVPELVSERLKTPGGLVWAVLPSVEMYFQPAEDGNGLFYNLAYGAADATAGGDLRYLATRGDDAWSSVQLTPAATVPLPSGSGEWTGRYQFLPSDLSCGVLTSAQPLTPDASSEVRDRGYANLFRRNADGSHRLLAPEPSNLAANPAASLVNGGYDVAGASSDCKRVVFGTPFRFAGVNDSGLYVSDDGIVRDVAVLPDGSTASQAAPGSLADSGTPWRAVSKDGTHVYFTAVSNDGNDAGKRALYLHVDGSPTVKASASETATPNQRAFFQTAATDGSKVAFLANYGLTSSSSTGPVATNCTSPPPQPCALYVYDAASGDLTDVSADGNPADTNGATVAGVIAASDDLSRIYFAAQGQLVPDEGRTYAANSSDGTYNVYLYDGGVLRYVALVSGSDLTTAGVGNLVAQSGANAEWTAQVNPSGSALLFSSRLNIVGYDSGGVTEAYLFSLETGDTVCVSCRRDGNPPVDDPSSRLYRVRVLSSSLSAALVRNRWLSDDGRRVFFLTPNALAPGATDGATNIYEWDDGAVRLLHSGRAFQGSAFDDFAPGLIGASASGDDVFISTAAGLDPNDTDGVRDVYDFRVGGRVPVPPIPAVECEALAGECQGGGARDVPVARQTDVPSGAGDVALEKRRTLAVKGFSKRARRRASRTGSLVVAVRTNKAGRVRAVAKGRIGKRIRRVAGESIRVRKPGAARLRLRLSWAARRRLQSGHALALSIKVSSPGARSRSKTVRLPGASS